MEEELKQRFTVKDLLTIPQFEEAVLLGGRNGLEQMVSRINVMEVPDVIHWVRPGEFLMTTGYPFREDPLVLVTLIEELAQKGVVALGIKTKRFIDAVPEAAIRAADYHGLPLIELPPSTTFSDVVREVMERVLVAESRHLSILQARVQRLSQVLLHGDGLPAFLRHLQLLVGNPVVLLDPGDRWMASPSAEPLCRQISETGWRKLREDSGLETSFIQTGSRTVRVHISSVPSGQTEPFLLLMLEYESEYVIVDTLTMSWAGELAGFEISNAQARQKIEAKYIDQFLQDWISGRIVSPADLRLRAEACGCPLTDGATYIVGAVNFPQARHAVSELQELARRLNWDAATRKLETRWTVMEERLVALLTIPGDSRSTRRTTGKDMAEAAVALLRSAQPEQPASLCLGREVREQEAVHISYREARRAAEVSGICGKQDTLVHYHQLGVYMLLFRLQGTEELEEFKRLYLDPLLAYDQKHQSALLGTLRTYFQCNGNAKETAERLFVHYNTISYRLERIRSELGIPLEDPETKLRLQLAIKLSELSDLP